jgi:hypothetical protein
LLAYRCRAWTAGRVGGEYLITVEDGANTYSATVGKVDTLPEAVRDTANEVTERAKKDVGPEGFRQPRDSFGSHREELRRMLQWQQRMRGSKGGDPGAVAPTL